MTMTDESFTKSPAHRVNVVLWIILGLVVVSLVTGILAVRATSSQSSVLHQVRSVVQQVDQGNQVGNCKSKAHLPVDAANAAQSEAQSAGLRALASGNGEALAQAITASQQADAAYKAANASYAAAVAMAVHNPITFLAHCKENN